MLLGSGLGNRKEAGKSQAQEESSSISAAGCEVACRLSYLWAKQRLEILSWEAGGLRVGWKFDTWVPEDLPNNHAG